MWPDCSPPSDSPRASISSITYLSPTAQRTSPMPRVAQRDLETDVAHHGRDDRVALQPPFALQLAAAHQQHRVAVRRLRRGGRRRSRGRRRRRTPRPCRQPRLDDGLRQLLGMGRAAAQVDVAAVGLVADDDRCRSPRLANSAGATASSRRWRNRSRASSPASGVALREHGAQVVEIGADEIALCDTAPARRRVACQDGSATIASTSRSTRSVNFSPRPENTLMPLSSNGLCEAEMTTPAS